MLFLLRANATAKDAKGAKADAKKMLELKAFRFETNFPSRSLRALRVFAVAFFFS
jgi:hypothetical protein